MNIFRSEINIYLLKISQDSPLNSTSVTLLLFTLYKRIISYDRAKLKKADDFYALTWLIFAGPVTYLNLSLLFELTIWLKIINAHSKVIIRILTYK